jgi:hypothetical protein
LAIFGPVVESARPLIRSKGNPRHAIGDKNRPFVTNTRAFVTNQSPRRPRRSFFRRNSQFRKTLRLIETDDSSFLQ